MNRKTNQVRKLVMASMLAALTCIATMIQMPVPGGNGYVHLGDCFVLLSGWLLGPIYGAAAAGIGSMLADIFSGYAIYAPATLIIKALSALLAAVTVKAFNNLLKGHDLPARVLSGICGGVIVPVGYFIYEWCIFGLGIASIDVLWIALKEIFGIACAVMVYFALHKTKVIEKYFVK
jgi:uncharacterized membrane protein